MIIRSVSSVSRVMVRVDETVRSASCSDPSTFPSILPVERRDSISSGCFNRQLDVVKKSPFASRSKHEMKRRDSSIVERTKFHVELSRVMASLEEGGRRWRSSNMFLLTD